MLKRLAASVRCDFRLSGWSLRLGILTELSDFSYRSSVSKVSIQLSSFANNVSADDAGCRPERCSRVGACDGEGTGTYAAPWLKICIEANNITPRPTGQVEKWPHAG